MTERGPCNVWDDDLMGGMFTAGCGCCRRGKGDFMCTELQGMPLHMLLDPKREFRCPFSATCKLSFNWDHEMKTSPKTPQEKELLLLGVQKALVRHFKTACLHQIHCPYCSVLVCLKDVCFHLCSAHFQASLSSSRKRKRFHISNTTRAYRIPLAYLEPGTNDIIDHSLTLHLPVSEVTDLQVKLFRADIFSLFQNLLVEQRMPLHQALREVQVRVQQFKNMILPPVE